MAATTTQPGMEKAFIISIHDFTPKYASELEEILSELNHRFYTKKTLFVIPRYYDNHFTYPLTPWTKTTALLQKELAKKNEICLHGYYHTRFNNSPEFKTLHYAAARKRIHKAKQEFAQFKASPAGFVAPYWKIGSEAAHAVRDEGFAFLIKSGAIIDLGNNVSYRARPICFWPHNTAKDYAPTFEHLLASPWLAKWDLVRVDIHPEDLWKPGELFTYGLKLIDHLSQERQLLSYQEYIDAKTPAPTV